jgi:hypothetical protein
VTACRQAGHETVAGTGPEARADVEPGGDAVEQHTDDQQRCAGGGVLRRGEGVEHRLQDQTQDHHVAQRAETRALPQGDPEEQQQRADQADPDAGADTGQVREALVQDVPGDVAEAREQDQRRAEAVEDQTGVELDEAAGEAGLRGPGHGAMLARMDLYG